MNKIYYLVYKLSNSDILWIVNTSKDSSELYKNTNKIKYKFNDEKYMIIQRKLDNDTLEKELIHESFKQFKINPRDKIIFESK